MDFDALFHALADPTRRRLLDELAERDGQTLFELHVRLTTWHGTGLSRQGMSKHLAVLEAAGLLKVDWQWRSKHHFLQREPIRLAWKLWLQPLANGNGTETEESDADCSDEHHGG
jgi:DNA-binding transcriptional ArsR family regulator